MSEIIKRLKNWRDAVAKVESPSNVPFRDGRLAGIDDAVSLVNTWLAGMTEHSGCDGCSTGDCPHTNVNDCVAAQAKTIAEQSARIADLERERERVAYDIGLALDRLRQRVDEAENADDPMVMFVPARAVKEEIDALAAALAPTADAKGTVKRSLTVAPASPEIPDISNRPEKAESSRSQQNRVNVLSGRPMMEGINSSKSPNSSTADAKGGASPASDRIYPCAKCGKKRSKDEGGTTFSVCDECWASPASEGTVMDNE